MPRLFFALEIPTPLKRSLLRVTEPVAGAKWQTASQMHLTLFFLGNVAKESVAPIVEAMRNFPVAGFDLEVHGVGCFGRPETPRALWAGVEPEAPVQSLNATLKERLAHLGLPVETRPFRPHITLARFKKIRGSVESVLAKHGQDRFGTFPVGEFVLLESHQGADGSVYTVVGRFDLAGAPDETPGPDKGAT